MHRPWLKHYPQDIPSSLAPYPLKPLYRLLTDTAHYEPETVATVFYHRQLTYRQLDNLSSSFANSLQTHPRFQPHARIGILLPNSPPFVIAYFGSLKAGLVPVLYNTLSPPSDLSFQIETTQPAFLVCLDRFFSKLPRQLDSNLIRVNLAGFLSFPLNFISRLSQNPFPAYPATSFGSLLRFPSSFSPPSIHPQTDTASILFTSGVRGRPKAVELTHYNLVANTIQTAIWGRANHEQAACVMPFFHSFGLMTALLCEIYSASTLHLYPKLNVNQLINDSITQKTTYLCAVPLIYNLLSQHKHFPKAFPQIKAMINGGESIDHRLLQRYSHLPFFQGYGLTETSPTCISNTLHVKSKPGSIGIPVPDTDIKIINPLTHRKLSANQTGELLVKGPQVMKGYFKNPSLTQKVLRSGWLYTGDLARMDPEGYIYFVGRKGKPTCRPKLNL